MFKAGDVKLQTIRPQPLTNSMLFTTKDVNRLAEMCAMFAWRRRCRIAQIDIEHNERWGYTQARVSIQYSFAAAALAAASPRRET